MAVEIRESDERQELSAVLSREIGRQPPTEWADGSGVVPFATARLLSEAMGARASDIHLDPQSSDMSIRFRIDGVIHEVARLPHDRAKQLVNQIKTMADLDPVATFTPQDSRRTHKLGEKELDLRVACARVVAGEKMTLRLLDPERVERRIGELGLRERMLHDIERWLSNVSGTFLVTGPTGCGKTTTLYALLHELKLLKRSIVTIEEPVEYQIDGVTQMQVDEERGLTFAEGIKAILRLDPDYMLLGEIRDGESARAAIDAAISGRVLLSTLHSRDAVGAMTALRNWGLQNREICAAVAVVVAQRLVRKLCPHCRRHEPPNAAERKWLSACGHEIPEKVWHPGGCDRCGQLGFHGRTGVFEVWHLAPDDYELILANSDERTVRNWLAERGHGFLIEEGLAKAAEGITCLDELRTMGGFGPGGSATGKPRPMAG